MRWTPVLSDRAEMRLRIVLLAIAVLASVLLPYLILLRTVEESRGAAAWVTHSAEIKQTTSELMYNLRDIENVLLAMYTGTPVEEGATVYATGRARIQPLLDRLSTLTRDNPEQQTRIGALEAVIAGRIKLFDEAFTHLSAKSYDPAGAALAQARALFAFRVPAQEILDHEQRLFVERSQASEAGNRQSRYATLGALLAQLVLLGAVIFVSERQTGRRLAAESLATQAVARSRAVVQNVREPILLLDPSLRLLMTNEAFREVYGGSGDEATGAGLVTLANGAWDDSVLLQRLADVAARGRELWDYELAQRTGEIERIVLVNARRIE